MTPAEKEFWTQLEKVGREVLDQGKKMGFGMSLVEIKFRNGEPAVLVRSISINTKYPDDESAKVAIAQQLEHAENTRFEGSRTLTIVYNKGHIGRVLMDEYQNHLLM
jgi:hypothetical protein